MATYTSSQTGNFSASSTWGGAGVPGDGDSFVVTNGHTVTIDTGISVPTNGYADSNVYGILQSQASANTTLRMNGRLYINTNGLLHLRDGAKIQINGSSAEQHGIWQENQSGASVIMEGSDGMPSTTTTAAVVEGSTVIPVTSAADFATGEWIAVFDNITEPGATNYYPEYNQDEGFWIHDISGNNVYFRIFGGPDHVSVSSASGSNIVVTNSKVFRVGQQIIFGTGANRNVKTITAIDYGSHTITCDGAITGSVSGQTVYLTGTEKYHKSGVKVRKVATITTAATSNGGTSITVADASMFSTGDEIWIEWHSEADGSTDYAGNYNDTGQQDKTKHVVSSVSSNVITLSSSVTYNVIQGALVTRLSRNIVCETVATDGSDYAFFYNEYVGDYSKTFILKDVYFRNWGNDDANYMTGVAFRGFHNSNHSSVTVAQSVPAREREPWIEGIVVHGYPENTHNSDWGNIWSYDARYSKIRCCVTINGDDGISVYYEPGASVVNSISISANAWSYRLEGGHEDYEFAYLYSSRSRYGIRFINNYEMGLGSHDWNVDATQYGIMNYGAGNGPAIYRSKFTGIRYGQSNEASDTQFVYCQTKTLSGLPSVDNDTGTPQRGSYWSAMAYRTRGARGLLSVEHNYEYDSMRIFGFNWEANWDVNENCWKFYRVYDTSDNPAMLEMIYIPANVTVRLSCKVKLTPGFSGTYPYLIAQDLISSRSANVVGNSASDNTKWGGLLLTQQYSSSAASDFEEEQLTINAKPFQRNVIAGILSNNANATEGFWIKDFKILLDSPYAIPPFEFANSERQMRGIVAEYRTSFDEQKIRLGGRLA